MKQLLCTFLAVLIFFAYTAFDHQDGTYITEVTDVYENVTEGMSLKYMVGERFIKEDIILSEKSSKGHRGGYNVGEDGLIYRIFN